MTTVLETILCIFLAIIIAIVILGLFGIRYGTLEKEKQIEDQERLIDNLSQQVRNLNRKLREEKEKNKRKTEKNTIESIENDEFPKYRKTRKKSNSVLPNCVRLTELEEEQMINNAVKEVKKREKSKNKKNIK